MREKFKMLIIGYFVTLLHVIPPSLAFLSNKGIKCSNNNNNNDQINVDYNFKEPTAKIA